MATKEDVWDGDEYLSKPGVLDSARLNGENLLNGLKHLGLTAQDLSTMHALEVGAGPGTVTRHLQSFASIYAIEPSAGMVRVLARQAAESGDYAKVAYAIHELGPHSAQEFGNGTPQPSPTPADPERKLPAPSAAFDVALATLVPHHVSHLDTFFRGVWSVLKPGGYFVVVEFMHGPQGEDYSKEYHVAEDPTMEPVDDDNAEISGKQFRTTWTRERFGRLLEKSGFVQTGGMDGLPNPAFGREGVPVQIMWGRRPE